MAAGDSRKQENRDVAIFTTNNVLYMLKTIVAVESICVYVRGDKWQQKKRTYKHGKIRRKRNGEICV
jgi:hypothetical protein